MGATLSLATSNLFAFPVSLYCFYFNYFSSFFGKMKTDLKKYSSSNDSPQTSKHFDPASLSKCSYGNSADIYNLAESTLNKTMISSYIQKNGLTPGQNGISYHNEKSTGIRPNYCYISEIKEAPPNAVNMVKTQKTYNNYNRCPDRAISTNNGRDSKFLERLIQNIAETVRSYSWWQSGYVHENPYSFNSTFVNQQNRCPRERLPYTNRLEKMASMYTTNPQNYMPTYDNPRCPPRRLSRDPSLFAKTHWFRESANDKTPKAQVHPVESTTTSLDPSPVVENHSHPFLEPDIPLTMSSVLSSEEKQGNSQSPSICTHHTNGPHHHHHQQEEIMISEPEVSPTNYDVVFFQSHGVLPGDPAVNTCQILDYDLPREDVQNGILEMDEVVLTDCSGSVIAYSFSAECEDDDSDEDELALFSEIEDDEDSDSDYFDWCPSPLPPFKNHVSSPCKLESNYSDDDDDDDDDDDTDSSSSDDLEVDCCASRPNEGPPVIKRPDSPCRLLHTDNKFLISPDDFNAVSQDEGEDDDDYEIDEDEWNNMWSRTSPPDVSSPDEEHRWEINTCDRFSNPFFSATLIISASRTYVLGSPVPSSADDDITPRGDEEQLNCASKTLQNLEDANKRWNEAYNCDDDDHHHHHHNSSLQNNRKVTFATGKNLQTRHLLICWSFAYQSARKGPWMNLHLDTMRFHDKINELKSIIDPVLDPAHRQKVFNLQAAKEST